jgi:flagellar biosynthetic protein FlhB
VAKILVVGFFAVLVLMLRSDDLMALGKESLEPALIHMLWIIGWAMLVLSASLILIALIDVPFQIWDNIQKLKMTRQEVKEEFKNTEGKPEVRSRIRQLQREIAERRMMSEVPKADVVITNPEHFSVALRYDPAQAGAPFVVAKGIEEVALKIREIAVAHQVEVIEAPPLCRSIYHTTRINQEIPSGLYQAVAQVLAYVYQLNQYRANPHHKNRGKPPGEPPDFQVPEDLRY